MIALYRRCTSRWLCPRDNATVLISCIKIDNYMATVSFFCYVDRCQACEYPIFEDLLDDKWYRIVIPSFLIGGGDGHYIFKNSSRNHQIGTLDMDHLTNYVTKMSPIFIGTERRLIFE
jgi:hypothetical protein